MGAAGDSLAGYSSAMDPDSTALPETETYFTIPTRHPRLTTMQHPTSPQLLAAIEVLRKLSERVNTHTSHSVQQLPDSLLGNDYSSSFRAQGIEQNAQITFLITELECWRLEVQEQRRQSVSHRV